MNYRTAQPRPDRVEVVHHRPLHPLAVAGICVLFLAVPAFLLSEALDFWRGVEVECERGGAHSCDVRRDYGLFTTHQAVPIPQIQRVAVSTHKGKNSPRYGVVLELVDGGSIKVMRPTSRDDAENARAYVEAIVRSESPGVEKHRTQEPNRLGGGLMALFGLAFSSLLLLMTRTARLEFYLDRGSIGFVRQRWPLPPYRRTFRLTEVLRARVNARPGSKGGTIFEAMLVLAGGEELVLLPNVGGSESRVEASVAEINAQLARMRVGEG